MKLFFIGLLLIQFFIIPIFSQNDPLEGHSIIHNGGGQEIIYSSPGSVSIFKYYKAMEISPRDTVLSVLGYSHSGATGIPDMITSDLDADSLSEIVKTWIEGSKVKIAVLKPDPNLLSIDTLANWQKINTLEKTSPVPVGENNGYTKVVLVESGNFDSDPQREFVIAYLADNGTGKWYVNITLYDVDDSLNVTEKGSIMDQQIEVPSESDLCEDNASLFDIKCGDFNGDGKDEILLSGREPANPSGWQLFTNIYAYDEATAHLIAEVKKVVYTQPNPAYDLNNINLAAGHFATGNKDMAIIGFCQGNPIKYPNPDTVSYTIIPIEVNDLLTDITAGSPVIQKLDTLGIDCLYDWLSTLKSKDVNNDGIDEVISAFSVSEYSYAAMETFKIYRLSSGLNLSVWANLDSIADNYHACIAMGNINREEEGTTSYPEFTLYTYNDFANGSTSIYQLQYDENGAFTGTSLLYDGIHGLWPGKSEPIQVAECDGDIRIGTPLRFSATDILQPLVILNAPPIHFDVFDNQPYDVSLSYNQNNPKFVSSYVKQSSQLTELTTEFKSDVALSTEVSAGVSFWGVSVSSYFSQSWAKKFDWGSSTTTKVTVGISADASVDDEIYATVMDYDIWEYPIYVNDKIRAHALVVQPNVVENRWFPSKSWSGQSYIPDHEVGNILSYKEYPVLSNNPEVDEKIKGDYNNSFSLDANSSYDWLLQFDDFQSSQSSTTKEYTRDWGASASGWGAGFSINGHYHSEDINTQRTEVASGLNLGTHLDGIDMGIGEVGYIVTPYAYWAKNGALVLDYAVKPELAQPGFTPTWWQTHYDNLSDPAFILPWLYDPEKGFTLQEDIKRYQTKDIQFLPANPVEDDTVTIEVRIHNFSLIPTPAPVSVSFYLGDPDSSGVLLKDMNGDSEVFTNEAIAARGTEVVDFKWIVSGVGSFPRIFAVIDKENSLDEIHEDNNKAWTILNKTTTAVDHNKEIQLPTAFRLYQNYPNPFNPSTKISWQLPVGSRASLKVYDVLGKEVATLVNEYRQAGKYETKFNAETLPSGVYFYRLQAGSFVQTRKMILLK
jgi:hypothetical protein